MPLILPNDIANEQLADGDKLQQNFATIEDYTNQELIHRSGSVAMTGALLLPGAPTQPNQAATKDYVDRIGVTLRVFKSTFEGGFDASEWIIAGLSGVISPLADRYTTVRYGLIIPSMQPPAVDAWVYVGLRLGTTVTDPIYQYHVHNWSMTHTAWGAGAVALQGTFLTGSFNAGQQAVLTLQTSSTLVLDIGAGSYMIAVDEGAA